MVSNLQKKKKNPIIKQTKYACIMSMSLSCRFKDGTFQKYVENWQDSYINTTIHTIIFTQQPVIVFNCSKLVKIVHGTKD